MGMENKKYTNLVREATLTLVHILQQGYTIKVKKYIVSVCVVYPHLVGHVSRSPRTVTGKQSTKDVRKWVD